MALKEKAGDPCFLFRDDSQIARLLVWKIEREEQPGWNTDSLTISFRVHDDDIGIDGLEDSIIVQAYLVPPDRPRASHLFPRS